MCWEQSQQGSKSRKYKCMFLPTYGFGCKPPNLQAGNHLSWKGPILWNMQNNMVGVVPDTLGIGQEVTI